MIRSASLLALVLSCAAAAHAQEPPDVLAFTSPMNIEFMSAPMALETDPVADAPYSAEAVTEVVQTLADGNRIVRQSRAQISRDGKGRTRREQGLAMFGPLVNAPQGGEHRSIQISDPVAGTMVMLDSQSKTAHRMPAPRLRVRGAINGQVVDGTAVEAGTIEKFEMALPPPDPASGAPMLGGVFMGRHAVAAMRVDKPVVEQLGTQFMEGVTVEGTRTKTTIPAGQIGNEQPIEIVSERWTSPELKVLVMSRQSDPRFGVTTYRLTNLTRGEPAPDLFEIPADFKVVEPGGGMNREIIMERRILKSGSRE